MKNSNQHYGYLKILAVIGIILASYLFYSFLFHPTFQPCSINAQINCSAVTKGPLRLFLGIPVPLIGLLGYIIILIASFLKKNLVVLGMSLFGFLFCIRLIYLEIFQIKVICPVCVCCMIVMTTILVLSTRRYALEKKAVTE